MLKIIGMAPHPPIIIPEIGRGELSNAGKTVEGMKKLSQKIKETEPELLVVISPHGQIMRGGPAVLTGDRLAGDFGQFGFSEVKIEMHTDQQLAELLAREAETETVNPVFLDERDHRFSSDKILDHGAMVPLYYLQEAGLKVTGLHITISFDPYRELYRFGQALRRAVEKRGASTAVLASGDLSHRLKPGAPAGFSPRGEEFDRLLVELLRDGRVDDIFNIDQGLVEEAGECGLRSFMIALGMLEGEVFKPEIISYEGPFGVGYMVGVLYPEERGEPASGKDESAGENPGKPLPEDSINPAGLARRVLKYYLEEGKLPAVPSPLPPEYETKAGVFVSLKEEGKLRGCIGTVEPVQDNIAEEIAANAVSAAVKDPRFPPLKREELPEVNISVDILGPMEPISSEKELDPKKYGVLIRSGSCSGLLLPKLEGVDTVEEQMDIVRQKAGVGPGEPLELYRFKVTRYEEE